MPYVSHTQVNRFITPCTYWYLHVPAGRYGSPLVNKDTFTLIHHYFNLSSLYKNKLYWISWSSIGRQPSQGEQGDEHPAPAVKTPNPCVFKNKLEPRVVSTVCSNNKTLQLTWSHHFSYLRTVQSNRQVAIILDPQLFLHGYNI